MSANPLREIAFSAHPFIPDNFPHPFEHPSIPIFTRDAVQVIEVVSGGYDGSYYCEDFVGIVDHRYGRWLNAHQGDPNYTIVSDLNLAKLQAATRGDWAESFGGSELMSRPCDGNARPSYPYTSGQIVASVKVAQNVYRAVYYVLDGDYWKPVGMKFEPRVSETARFVEVLGVAIAVVGVAASGGALMTAIQGGQLGVGSVVKFVSAIDRLPGVDFGDVSSVLSYINRLSSVSSLATSLADSGSSLTDAAGSATSGTDFQGDSMDYGLTDITLPNPDDFGAGFGDFAFNGGAIDFGTGFGGLDFTDAVGGFDVASIPFDSALDSLTQSSTSWLDSIDLTKIITTLAQTYAQYRIADQQQGPRPGSAPTPGQVRTLPDGSTVRTNPDGSSTVSGRDGSVTLITPTGQIIPQAPRAPTGPTAPLMPGVSNQTLLIGAAVAAAALLLLRRN